MPDTHLPSGLPIDMAARALGAALLETGLTLTFDAETGALVHANEAAIFLLEISEDAFGDHTFDALCRADGSGAPDLWSALRSGSVRRWRGTLVATLSSSEHPVDFIAACSDSEGGTGHVILHATESDGQSAQERPAPTGAVAALGDVVGIIEFDADGVVLTANDRAKMALEFYSEEMTGRGHDSLWPASITQTPDYVAFWEKLREGRIVEGRHAHVTAEGNIVWLQSTYIPRRGDAGHVSTVVQCLMDVTDETERSMVDAARARAAWSVLAVAELDIEGHVLASNSCMQSLLGSEPDDLTGKHLRRFMDAEFALGATFRAAWDKVVGGEAQQIDIPHLNADHQLCWTRSQFVPVPDASGRITAIYEIGTVIHDDHERLANLETRYDALSGDLAIVEWDVTGRLIEGNARYAELLGFDRGKLKGLDHRMTVPQDFAKGRRYSLFWDRLNQGERVSGQFRRLGVDGKDAWFQASYVPLRRETDGRIETVFFYGSDISEVKLGQIHAQARMDAIERSMAVIEFEMDGTIISANKVFVETVGYSLEELKGRKHAMLCPPDFAKSEEYRRFWERLGEGQIIEQEVRRVGSGGRELWFQASYNPILDLAGQPIRVVKYAYDITDVRIRQAKLEEKWQTTSRAHPICEFDCEGKITGANEAFLRTAGYSLREIVGQHHSMFCTLAQARSQEYRDFWQDLAKGEERSDCYHYVARFDRDMYLQANFSPIHDTSGAVSGVIMHAIEVTDHVRLRDETEKRATEVGGQIEALREAGVQIRGGHGALSEALTRSRETLVQGEGALASGLRDMGGVTGAIEKIDQIVEVVAEIAVQTNLLAFNAAIEAARAGEYGVGFSIVADEVRKLAERNADAARDISRQLEAASESVGRGTGAAQETIAILNRTADDIRASGESVSTLMSNCEAQSQTIGAIGAVMCEFGGRT
ncbi:methyl-accepting chemotaxis protein [Roseivivax halodurans JCM 10272]|uniref:Methyl-accepting chemotaxis protein n=2 Tax=Roseivivax halodurans TaxID=93683 RepID=X7EL54_9RHOB|nr:PAS domain-containing protein [Roseivivax halodurans]ETX15873.1 methyl-accepting chemotaxis protein [Roseivivax halodurans JCM 10272]